MLDVVIRAAERADVDRLMSLVEDAAGAPHWSAATWRQVLASAEERRHRAVMVAELEGETVGFGVMGVVGDEAEVESLAVAAGWRRRGVGARLCERMFEWARAQGAERVQLEVRMSNERARVFYRGLGFHEQGRRPRYYRDPDEDAQMMMRRL